MGVIFPGGGEFSQGAIFSGEILWGIIFTWGSFHRGEYSYGGIFKGVQFCRGKFSGGGEGGVDLWRAIFWGEIFLIPKLNC